MMGRFRILWLAAFAAIGLLFPGAQALSTNLVFDAFMKEFTAKPGDLTAEFEFAVTNTGPTDITINSVHASCGCTTPKLPELPWTLKPGTNGSFYATVDLRGKFGTFQKTISLETTEGMKLVMLKCILPNNSPGAPGMDPRTRNMQLANADRQIVFRADCAACHATPAAGKKGEELFTAACAICHEAEHRAALVADLHNLKQTPTEAYWDAWVRNGKVGTMMPAFAHDQGGPLSDEQITSLVSYMMTDFPTRKPHPPATANIQMTASTPQPGVQTTLPPIQQPVRRPISVQRQRLPPAPLPGSGPLFSAPPPAPPSSPSPVPDNQTFKQP